MSDWLAAVNHAQQLQADFPGWRARAVQRRDNRPPGVAAWRRDGDGDGVYSVMGTAAEVRAALAQARKTAPRRPA